MAQENPQEVLLAVVDKALEMISEGKQAKAQHVLPFVYQSVMQFPNILWDNVQVWKIAKIFFVMHHYDMIEDEDEEIKMLQMALVYTQRAKELCENQNNTHSQDYFSALQTQAILYSSCSDYYSGTIAELYSKTVMSGEERVIANRLANRVLPIMSYNSVVKIDENFESFNNDSFSEEICNQFELEHPDITPKQLDDAEKIHKMLIHTYLRLFD